MYTCIIVVNIAYVTRDLNRALLNAFQQLGTPEVILKPELVSRSQTLIWSTAHIRLVPTPTPT